MINDYKFNSEIKALNDSIRKVIRESDAAAAATSSKSALIAQMNRILADGYFFYFKAHTFHWNVTGSNFPQYHEFFGTVYEQVFGNLDPIAEQIRALGVMAPVSIPQMASMTTISHSSGVPSAEQMFGTLIEDNEKIIAGLTAGYKLAESAGEAGLSNFLQDLIDKHKKLAWMIKSTKGE